MLKSHNIYIHVPFCMSKCNYCAFYSFACNNPDWNLYCENICNEIKRFGTLLNKTIVPTIFFGGGTPSLLPLDVFEKIINCIKDNFSISKNCEVTIEANPGTIDKDKLCGFVQNGVNRLSVGIQALNDKDLLFLGRKHNVKTGLDLLEIAQNMKVRVSADFIYGLPNQKVDDIITMCKEINNIGLKHVSMYELTIEKNTPFGKMNLQMPDNEIMAQMYTAISDTLNLKRYEVSNYSIPGEECLHNQNVWSGEAYLGIGKGAAGRPFINNIWYEQMGNNEVFEKMSDSVRAIEKVITGLRMVRGVFLSEDVKEQINFEWVKNHNDLISEKGNYLFLSDSGMLLLDSLIQDLIL